MCASSQSWGRYLLHCARLLDAALVDADLARGRDDGGPGVVGQRYALRETLRARALSGSPGISTSPPGVTGLALL